MPAPQFFIDISTQLHDPYTGIANVAHQIIRWFRQTHAQETSFFFYDQIIEEEIIDEIILRKSGAGLRDLLDRRLICKELVSTAVERNRHRPTAALFPTAKTLHRAFGYEAQVIHDLTVKLMPEMHQQSTIDFHGGSLDRDLASNDLIVCVSQNTFDDLETYLKISPERMLVSHLGVDDGRNADMIADVEPFILILGTIEPRKNIELVLQTLQARPDVLDRWRFVFVGNEGWGKPFATLAREHGLDDQLGGRILHLGYVNDRVKDSLLVNARCVLYPSIYEGFGLPVAEALNVGTPVITSLSSSLVEVGGSLARYVDPYSIVDLASALDQLDASPDDPRSSMAEHARRERRLWASQFRWDRFCKRIYERIRHDLER